MRYYVKVADALCGVGFTRGYWTRKGVEKAAKNLRAEFGNAVWIYTAAERREYEA